MAVMGAEETLTTTALPRLLVFMLAACGGRYSSQSGSEDAGGKAGSASSVPGDEPGGVGTPGRGGSSSTGTGGSGITVGGKSVGMGGSGFGTAGTAIGVAGMLTGSGGNNPGYPTDPKSICLAYCSAHAAACPEEDAAVCSKQCFGDLVGQSNACRIWAWEQYECITRAFQQTMSCSDGHYLASKLCGGDGGHPIPCDQQPCDVDIIFNSDDYCESRRSCAGGQSELRCLSTPDGPACSCWLNGLQAADVMTTVDTAREACLDEQLQWLCTKQLP